MGNCGGLGSAGKLVWVQEVEEEVGVVGCSPFSAGRGSIPTLFGSPGDNGDDTGVGEPRGSKSWVHRGRHSVVHS